MVVEQATFASFPNNESPIIVALDFDRGHSALQLVEQLDPSLCKLKVGKELFTREGPILVRQLRELGYDIFLDLKFHDIPNTTAKAVAAAADLGAWMVNVHALGGRKMMEAAVRQLETMGSQTLLIAVTVLTSMSVEDIQELGLNSSLEQQVRDLACLARNSGLDGVVCSPREAAAIVADQGQEFLRVTPGIRPYDTQRDDQVRVMTPALALAAGSSYLVIGRPITRAPQPRQALLDIVAQIGEDASGEH